MGFSVPIATNSLKKANTQFSLFIKIAARSLKMFVIGVMLNSRHGVQLSDLRIFGVLQRISICYFIVTCLELLMFKRIYKNNSTSRFSLADLCILAIVFIWYLIVFYLEIPGCPSGYFGPGGLEHNSLYYNCTGGATGYIDKLLLGPNHMYSRPTSTKIYKSTEHFDPEGILGTFNSVLLTYLGVRAGRVIIFNKNKSNHILSWLKWALGCLVIYYFLTNFDMEKGLIPVNKNLWTLTFSLLTGCSSFIILSILYYIIDLKQLYWTGNPFNYLGSNSILIYISHCLFNRTIPCQFIVSNTHFAQVLINLWGAIFWTLISIYLDVKNIFLNL